MSEFDFDVNDFDEGGSAGGDLREPGVHDVTIRHISVEKKSNGVIAWSVTVNGGGQYDDTFYEAALRFTSGKEFGTAFVLKPIVALCGVNDIAYEDKTIEIKDGHKVIKVISGIGGQKLKLVLQRQWNSYHKRFDMKIIRAASEDGRTASEVRDGVNPGEGTQLGKTKFEDKTSDRGGSAGKTTAKTKEPDVDLDDDFDID